MFQNVQFVHLPREILETLRFNTLLSMTAALLLWRFFSRSAALFYLFMYFLNGNNFNKHASGVELQTTSKTAAAWQLAECETQLLTVFTGTTCAEHMTMVGGDICPGARCTKLR